MKQFEGRRGKYGNIPSWARSFEKEIRIELETLHGTLKANSTMIKHDMQL